MSGGFLSLSEYPGEDRAVLRVHVEYISLTRIEEFREACLRLLQTGMKRLTIDLASLRRVPSGVLAAVIDIGLLARNGMGPEEEVIVLANPAVARQFRLFDHSEVLDVQVSAGGEGSSALQGGTDSAAMAGG